MQLSVASPFMNMLRPTAVEVDIWEGYLLNTKNVAKALCAYSIDNGPLYENAEGTLHFRITLFDWERKVEDLLVRSHIHYEVTGRTAIDPVQQLFRKRIYIAEKDTEISSALSSMLEDAGYQVAVSPNGEAVVKGFFSRMDLFILDKQMRDPDGLEVCRHLRVQPATRYTPVIIVSNQPRSGNEALNAGANDYIEKPFEMHYFMNVVARWLKGRQV